MPFLRPLLLLTVALLAIAPARAFEDRNIEREQIRQLLESLAPAAAATPDVAALLRQLESDHFAERHAAQAALMNGNVPSGVLIEASRTASLDAATRIGEILRLQSDASIDRRLDAALFAIVTGKLSDLVGELVPVLEYRSCAGGNRWFLAIDAFRATASPASDAALRAALRSKDALVRAGALEGLIQIHKDKSTLVPILLGMTGEPHPTTAANVADQLIACGRVEGLALFARLLASDDIAVRSRSRDALGRLTGRDVSVSVFSEKEALAAAARDWEEWIAAQPVGALRFATLRTDGQRDAPKKSASTCR